MDRHATNGETAARAETAPADAHSVWALPKMPSFDDVKYISIVNCVNDFSISVCLCRRWWFALCGLPLMQVIRHQRSLQPIMRSHEFS